MQAIPRLTFEQFQATRREVASLGEDAALGPGPPDDVLKDVPGFVYYGGCYIYKTSGGDYVMPECMGETLSSDLALLERKLYLFAIEDGRIIRGKLPGGLFVGDVRLSLDIGLFERQREWFAKLPICDEMEGLQNLLDYIYDIVEPPINN